MTDLTDHCCPREYFRCRYDEFREARLDILALAGHKGYGPWTAALCALADEYGTENKYFVTGQSVGFCEDMIEAGADPDHLLSLLALCFAERA